MRALPYGSDPTEWIVSGQSITVDGYAGTVATSHQPTTDMIDDYVWRLP